MIHMNKIAVTKKKRKRYNGKNEQMYRSISHKQAYTVIINHWSGGRKHMDYKKEIIEMVQKIHNESIIKFIYGCVKRAYDEERVGK